MTPYQEAIGYMKHAIEDTIERVNECEGQVDKKQAYRIILNILSMATMLDINNVYDNTLKTIEEYKHDLEEFTK